MNRDNVRAVRDMLTRVPEDHFNMDNWLEDADFRSYPIGQALKEFEEIGEDRILQDCGTTACLWGWIVATGTCPPEFRSCPGDTASWLDLPEAIFFVADLRDDWQEAFDEEGAQAAVMIDLLDSLLEGEPFPHPYDDVDD